ncbi:exosortase A-associated hydrolase 2 [Mitsuaria sp. BK045]|uniref:hydrolase 2, exosortase A system-associated n=1 Tax=unclassified Roseateles TaxID=2626991 RepID=UPI001609C040|nr:MULTISPECIES: hydrolase 2, exosortase A system-associated [unclassified Roseateles]MBB3294078.1 exosortase A-associated hydrolase 2 [Mitsuaria sp. BK041]MBB3363295.1 exosortase A-associated hydrolase 2 [Mitsuaria sp. BK045]
MAAADTPFFLDAGARGQRLCVHHAAAAPFATAPRGQILLLPPFAEEMNKSRRMTALAARAFAAAGFEVLMLDLLGCGDSSGDFGDASWAHWQDDVRLAAAWLDARALPRPDGGRPPLWLWGLRAGALLAPAVFDAVTDRPLHLLLWQPVTAGKLQLQQFMRLRVAADLIGGQAKGAVQAMRDQLARGEPVEIAGYLLAPALAEGLDAAQLKPSPRVARVAWLELSPREDATLTPAASMAVQAWQAQGAEVRAAVCQGPSFWAATEIEEAPRLIEASLAALRAEADFAAAPAEAIAA